jgi:hypothetical protein
LTKFRCDNVDSWEYKLVKMRGYFEPERIFIRREKNGKFGYLVFAPFVSAHLVGDGRQFEQEGAMEIAKTGVFVNLGWVPHENVDEIECTNEPLPLLVNFFPTPFPDFVDFGGILFLQEFDAQSFDFRDKITGKFRWLNSCARNILQTEFAVAFSG